jgi:hypothetical protein
MRASPPHFEPGGETGDAAASGELWLRPAMISEDRVSHKNVVGGAPPVPEG